MTLLRCKTTFYSLALIGLFTMLANPVLAQKKQKNNNSKTTELRVADTVKISTNKSPVVPFEKDTLFYIYGNMGAFTPTQRAQAIEERIVKLSETYSYTEDSLILMQSFNGYVDIVYYDEVIMSVDSAQALNAKSTIKSLANEYRDAIVSAIDKERDKNSLTQLFIQIIGTIAILLGGYYLIKFVRILFSRLILFIKKQEGTRIKELFGFIDAEKQIAAYILLTKAIKIFVIIVILYLGLTLLFNLFPATRDLSGILIGYVISPIKSVLKGFIDFLPDLIKIIVIIVMFRYLVRILSVFTEKIADGTIRFKGFYTDWAYPTFNLIRGLLFVLLFIIVYNLIPNSSDPVFQGVSVFAGIIFSLGSTTVVNNFISGFVITYMRSFKVGDRIKIGEIVGDVVEKSSLVVRIKTPKNELITMPNSSVMGAQTVNYTDSADQYGLILYLNIIVDLNVPWKQVHDLLLKVAYRTENLSKKQKPFILQDRIQDQAVEYQLNVYVKDASLMSKVYSDLRQNVQDVFREAGVDLFAPMFYSNYEKEKESPSKNEDSQ